MTYKLNPLVRQFHSSIVLRFDDRNEPDRYFESGELLAEETFRKNYLLDSVCAQDNQIVLTVKENRNDNPTNWIGEEMVRFF